MLGVVPASGAEPAEPLDPEGGGELPLGGGEPEPVVLLLLWLEPELEDPELGPVAPVAPPGGAEVSVPLVELGAVPCCGWLALGCCCGCGGSTVVDDTCCVVGLRTGWCSGVSGLAVTGAAAASGVVTATTWGFGFAFFAFAG